MPPLHPLVYYFIGEREMFEFTSLLGEKGRRRLQHAAVATWSDSRSPRTIRVASTGLQHSWSNKHVRNSLVERDKLSRHLGIMVCVCVY